MIKRQFLLRIVSALVLAPFALVITWVDPAIFAGAVAAGGVILAGEWSRMTDPQGKDLRFGIAVLGTAGAIIAASAGYVGPAAMISAGAALVAAIEASPRGRAMSAAGGIVYIAVAGIVLVTMRLSGDPLGSLLLTSLFVIVWGADIGAYAAGKLIGRGALPASISAQKTWSGLVGGLVLGTVFALFVAPSFLPQPEISWALLLGALVAMAALAGDLLESAIKRHFDVKDAGSLIPGHGGLLDRLDSLLVAAPIFAVIVWWIMPKGSLV